MSWVFFHLPSFLLFGLHMACSDTSCCEEKQRVLPHNSDLNLFNPQLHDTVAPGALDTCTSALKMNESQEIDHDDLHCVDPTGSPIPSASAVPMNSLTPFAFNIETPSRFENGHIHDLPPSVAQLLRWDAPTNATTNSNQQKRKSSNVDVSTMGKCKSSNADASTMGPSKQ